MATDEQVPKLPNLDLAQARFLLATQDYAQKPEKQSFLLDTIKQNSMNYLPLRPLHPSHLSLCLYFFFFFLGPQT
jgi:hypothetical protein